MGKLKGISLLIVALMVPSLASAKVAHICGLRLLWGAAATIEESDLLFPADQTADRLDWNQIAKSLKKSNLAVRAHILIKMKTLGTWPEEMNSLIAGLSAHTEAELQALMTANDQMLSAIESDLAPYIKEFEGSGDHRTFYGLRHMTATIQRKEHLEQRKRELEAELIFIRARKALYGEPLSAG